MKKCLATLCMAVLLLGLCVLPAGAAEAEIVWLPEGVWFVSELGYSYDSERGWLNVSLDEDGLTSAIYDLNTGTLVEEYDFIGNSFEGLTSVSKDEKYGYINKDGELVIPMSWDGAWEFHDGAAIVMLDEWYDDGISISYYLIDTQGKLIAYLGYDIVDQFSEGLAAVQGNGVWGYINRDGEVISCQYDAAGDFSEGLAAVEKDGKWGYIDKTGKVVIPLQFDCAYSFQEGLAAVEIDDKLGYVNTAGELVIPPQYEASLHDDEYDYDYTYDWDFSEGLALVYRLDEKGVPRCGYIDKTGKEVIPCQYDSGSVFFCGLAAVEQNGKEGFVDKTGRLVVPFEKYDVVWNIWGGLGVVIEESYPDWKFGLIDQTGREVVPCEYDYADYISENGKEWSEGGFWYVQKGDRFGLVTAPAQPSVPAVGTAYPSTQTVDVDGKSVEFQCYALKDENGNDTNYIKLRDLADILNGSAAQFEVGWNGSVTITTQTAYTPNGTEQNTPFSGQREYREVTAQTLVNGEAKDLAAFTLTDDVGGGYTYYKLRDLGEALGFKVDWSAQRGIYIETK